MDTTGVENGSATKLVGIPEVDVDSDTDVESNFTDIESNVTGDDDDNSTVATAEAVETETMTKSALISMARKSFRSTRRKPTQNLRSSLQRRLSMSASVNSSSEEGGEENDFLLEDSKKKTNVQAADGWWKFVFVFSLISMTACILTLWLKYPYGARMNTEEVATMPWSNGCIGLDSCICPRVSPACEIRLRTSP